MRKKSGPSVKKFEADLRAEGRTLRTHAVTSTLVKKTYVLNESEQKPLSTRLVPVFDKVGYWFTESSFLGAYLELMLGILNYDFKLVPTGKDAGKKGSTKKLNEWLMEQAKPLVDEIEVESEMAKVESNHTNGDIIAAFARDVWMDYIKYSNVVALWLDNRQSALVIPIRRCEYSDQFAVEWLKYEHGLSQEEVERLLPDQQERFKKSTVLLDAGQGEHFKVLKKTRVGDGFGLPSVYSLFRTLGEVENKEIGMSRMSFLMRNVTRMHLLGHEIKQGNHAGKPTHFWSKVRSDEVKKAWKDTEGVNDFTANFDHQVTFPWPDLKQFDKTAWEGTDKRLSDWGGPIMKMLQASGVMPYLTPLAKAQAKSFRDPVGRFLSFVIQRAFKTPVEVKVSWSNLIFSDSRLLAEMIKFAYQNGLSSMETSRDEIGFDASEPERKLMEAEDKEARKKGAPLFDASHGTFPALGETNYKPPTQGGSGGGSGGRPAGTPNPA